MHKVRGAVLSWLYGKLYYLSIWDDAILQNFIIKLTLDWENVQTYKKKGKGEFPGHQVSSN
jgi:hypothetical protein